jgi:tetratricopeptide (TPR) repeat protein
VHENAVVLELVLVPHQDAPEVLKPGEEALHLPAPAEAAQFAPILRLAPLGPIGRDHVDATLTELYPDSGNAFDNLGEAYAANGNTDLAIAAYRKSVALNPENLNAVAQLAKLGAKRGVWTVAHAAC